jgi:hypothetical protein
MREKSLPDIASLIRATRYRRKPTPIGLGSFGSAKTCCPQTPPNERGWDRKTSLDRSRLQGLHRA